LAGFEVITDGRFCGDHRGIIRKKSAEYPAVGSKPGRCWPGIWAIQLCAAQSRNKIGMVRKTPDGTNGIAPTTRRPEHHRIAPFYPHILRRSRM
jgi:hypothetical protein